MNILRHVFKSWLPLAAAVTLLAGVIYLVNQQMGRLNANEPQIGLAGDAARALAAGQTVEAVLGKNQIDIAQSASPFLVIFDSLGKPVASSGLLHGALPAVPQGVLDEAKKNGENRLTWAPEPAVRLAAVFVPILGGPGGFVGAARSLREVEKRDDLALFWVAVGWMGALLASLVVAAGLEVLLRERKP
jgi:hypothetical protein